MKLLKYRLYLLPLLILLGVAFGQAGLLHISMLHIKSHELKLTNLDYNFLPGDVFHAGEVVSRNNYEDANISWNPDFKQMLNADLRDIARQTEDIDEIRLGNEISFYSGSYQIKLCLDHKKMSVLDSSMLTKTIYLDIVGQYELWDRDTCDRLLVQEGRKFWIRDSIIVKGLAHPKFINNKVNEIWLAQLTENALRIVRSFESPYEWYDKFVQLGVFLWYINRFEQPEFLTQTQLKYKGWHFYNKIRHRPSLSHHPKILKDETAAVQKHQIQSPVLKPLTKVVHKDSNKKT